MNKLIISVIILFSVVEVVSAQFEILNSKIHSAFLNDSFNELFIPVIGKTIITNPSKAIKKTMLSEPKISQLLVSINESFNATSGKFEPYYKSVYKYNANGYADILEEYKLDTLLKEWKILSKMEVTYNDSGILMSRVGYDFHADSEKWVPSLKLDYGLDTLSRIGMSNMYYFNSNQWDHVSARYLTYDLPDKPEYAISYMINYQTGFWEFSVKETFSYNESGDLRETETRFWDSENCVWMPFWLRNFEYDVYGNNSMEIISGWNQDSLKFLPRYKYEFTYDYDQLYSTIMMPQSSWFVGDFVNDFVHKPLYSVSSRLVNDVWTVDERTTYIYSDMAVGLNGDEMTSGIKVFPNPSNGIVTVELSTPDEEGSVSLFDLTGRKLIDKRLMGITHLSINHLNDKMLIYKVYTQQKSITGKLLLAK